MLQPAERGGQATATKAVKRKLDPSQLALDAPVNSTTVVVFGFTITIFSSASRRVQARGERVRCVTATWQHVTRNQNEVATRIPGRGREAQLPRFSEPAADAILRPADLDPHAVMLERAIDCFDHANDVDADVGRGSGL